MTLDVVTLTAAAMRCELRPDLGGCIAGLWSDGIPVLRAGQAGGITSARQSGNFPLVPFSNRIADARLCWSSIPYTLQRNFAPEAHAMHGIGWQRPWQLVDRSSAQATLRLVHEADGHWPFSFVCEQTVALSAGGVQLRLRLVSTDALQAPAGLGWHPYVVKRPGARLSFIARRMWPNDAAGLPLPPVHKSGLDCDCEPLEINNLFDGVPLPAGGVLLSDPLLSLCIRSDLRFLLVSTSRSKDFIALEPVSHVTNAFNQPDPAALGVATLRRGEALSACMSIEVRHRR